VRAGAGQHGPRRRGARRRVAVQTRRSVGGSVAAHGRHRGRSSARRCAQEQAARPCVGGPSGG
jgi:hypothetical protein